MFARPASLLPHDPTANTAVQTKTTPPIRRFSAVPRRPRAAVSVAAAPVGRNVPIHNQGGFWDTNYALQLQEKVEATRKAQELWLEDVAGQAQALRLEREEERLVRQNVYEQLRAEHQAQVIEAAEKRREAEEEENRRRRRIYEEQQAEQRARAIEAAEAAERRREAEEEERRRRRIYEEQQEVERQERAAEAAETRRRAAEEAERRRRERERECLACTDTADMGTMAQVACTHWYCRECLQGAFERSLAEQIPFQCCGLEASVDQLPGIFGAEFRNRYRMLVEELSTTNPIYCSNRRCGVFLPSSQNRGPDLVECGLCATNTCRHCMNGDHRGRECEQDIETQQARALATTQGWKACPRCSIMVEKREGCVHMTCRCRAQFCYRCGRLWGTVCSGSC